MTTRLASRSNVPLADATEAPPELWMLRAIHEKTGTPFFIPAVDEPRGAENYLVCLSESDAKAAAEHQNDMYEMDCTPFRVK